MKIAILLPTIYRPAGLRLALSSLFDSIIDAHLYHEIDAVIAGERDDVEARAIAAEYHSLFAPCAEEKRGPAYAYNTALAAAPGHDAYFLASDDCEFTRGWLEEALVVLSGDLGGSGVIGTNELHGKYDRVGFCVFYLMTRDFIVEHNGGLACYPYPVDYTDVEIVARARAVDKFAYAEKAVVKHNWIGSRPDESFMRNRQKIKQARQMFLERQANGFPDDAERVIA